MVGSSTNKQRFYDQAKKSQASTSGLFCVLGRGVASTPKEFQFNGHSLVLNYSD
ncbi:hypothetical protein FH597_08505 [Leptospira interrogans]|uniref:hypothetical protein n=1 Tax=Leptospira interrogans TaxID=173 RepID=UPI001EF1250B|nr:hypothetical protein [Leptospira interrogans]ULG78405.1 hypothetical protein FH597_08505 [Leptospira interrogans]